MILKRAYGKITGLAHIYSMYHSKEPVNELYLCDDPNLFIRGGEDDRYIGSGSVDEVTAFAAQITESWVPINRLRAERNNRELFKAIREATQ